ncbi:MAG: hypothetical protein AMXMBFR84_02500 [Candidatus Hydrogenedentota bacterium]
MVFVKSFKGYEDKIHILDGAVNGWLQQSRVDVVDIKVCMSHEPGGRAGSGDLVFVVMYKADAPVD